MTLDKVRADFPMLTQTFKDKPIIYFDNACMSLRPRPVIEAITTYYTHLSACGGRSVHRLASSVTAGVDETRRKVQTFLGAAHPEEIIFTRNTTEGINLVAHSIGLKRGDLVVTSDKEHNSNLVPWLKLKRTTGIKHLTVPSKTDNTFDMNAFEELLQKESVRLVSMVHTSNLDGVTFPLKEIIHKAHANGALVMIDAAQSAPHQPLNVKEVDVDFLAFSGHKLGGPSGMGILYGKKALLEAMEGFLVGGDTVEYATYTDYKHLPLPEKYEAGLQDYAGILGLGAAIMYLQEIGFPAIRRQEETLNRLISEGLRDEPRVHVIGPPNPQERGGIVSFYVDGADMHQIALLLDHSYGIMVRSGQHCVHSWFDAHNIPGSVRVSMYYYNTVSEAEMFVNALKKIVMVL